MLKRETIESILIEQGALHYEAVLALNGPEQFSSALRSIKDHAIHEFTDFCIARIRAEKEAPRES